MTSVAVTAACVAPREPAARNFNAFAGATMVAAAAALALAYGSGQWIDPVGERAFWLLAALTIAGELFAIRLAVRHHFDEITLSSPFALALLLAFGALPAMVVYAAASVLADARDRMQPIKAAFNAAQYVVALGMAAVAVEMVGRDVGPAYDSRELVPMLLAVGVFFVVNHVLAGTAAALLTARPVASYLSGDFGFHVWAAGSQLALAPPVLFASQTEIALVPLVCLPLLGIYFGGRQAVVNAHRSLHDDLTGLPNRRLLDQRLDAAVSSAQGRAQDLAVMVIDMDDFKAVNDVLGRGGGDCVLRAASVRMQGALPGDATLARLGGDEFAVVLPDADAKAAAQLADRMAIGLGESLTVESRFLALRASVGIASLGVDGNDAGALLSRAEAEMYQVKRAAGGRHAGFPASAASADSAEV